MESKEVTIVIVTYKSEERIINCLESISKYNQVIIVENSNNIDFKKKIEQTYKNVNCVLTGENKGYSKANNIGLNLVKTKYALVLNPDTILDKNAISNFISNTKLIKDFWLMGPANDQKVGKDDNKDKFEEVENLRGFAIFFNMSKFGKQFFDENFFLFFEEIDLCKRVKNKGGKIYLNRNVVIKHEGASSVKKDNIVDLEKIRNWHWMWSTFYFQKKYKGFLLALITISPKFFSAFLKTFFYFLILNKDKRDIYFCRLSGILNSIIGKSSWYRKSLD
jgi:GT2 family glycosyltransferase